MLMIRLFSGKEGICAENRYLVHTCDQNAAQSREINIQKMTSAINLHVALKSLKTKL